jgi:CheY-like chemotaxis protein
MWKRATGRFHMPDCKVLVIEDDEDTREALVALFRAEGYGCEGVADGLAALSLMTWGEFQPHIILVDLLMPGMDGDQFRAFVRQNPAWARIPIVLCSGSEVTRLTPADFYRVMQKPLDVDGLLSLVKEAVHA